MKLTNERKQEYLNVLHGRGVKTLARRALTMWASMKRDANAIGNVLAQMHKKLAKVGCTGAFSWWLRKNGIPRATAYRMIDREFGRISKKTRKPKAKGSKKPATLREQIIAKLKSKEEAEIVRYLSGIYSDLIPRANKHEIRLQPVSAVAMR